jgi:hypothetical protein
MAGSRHHEEKGRNGMNKLKALAAFAIGSAAFPGISHASGVLVRSDSVVVYDEPLDQAAQANVFSAKFAFNSENPEAGWAWVDITASSAAAVTSNYERRVPGLRYDAHAQQIVYQPSKGPLVVCANVKESGFLFFRKNTVETTGKCNLRTMVEQRPSNNGSHTEIRNFGKVVMDVSF